MIASLYILLLITLFFAWNYTKIKSEKYNKLMFNVLVISTLLLLVIFRDGNRLPDYPNYLSLFKYTPNRAIEGSFICITNFVKKFSNNPLWMFVIYAVISVSLKYFAILKYSQYIFYSLAVWVGSFLLLQEMIQIRGAVAGSILLLLIPQLYKRNILRAIILIIIASWFHRAAFSFIILLFLDSKKTSWIRWVSVYCVLLLLNVLGINPLQMIGLSNFLSGLQLLEGDIYDLSITQNNLNLFAPYILLQTITCFTCIYFSEKIKEVYPYGILSIKVCLLGIFFYSLPLGVVSLRLAELFSTAFIYTYPLLILCIPTRYRVISKMLVSIICISILTNFIFLKGFIM